jgi:hypothetical protein
MYVEISLIIRYFQSHFSSQRKLGRLATAVLLFFTFLGTQLKAIHENLVPCSPHIVLLFSHLCFLNICHRPMYVT